MTQDLTVQEANAERLAFEREIGHDAEIYVDLNRYGEAALGLSLYPRGVMKECAFRLKGDSFRDLLQEARTKWEEHRNTHARRTIDALALEIIRITDAYGECTDAALRAAGHHGADVARYGGAACSRADEMAGRGPFSLRTLGGDNGAPVDGEEDDQ